MAPETSGMFSSGRPSPFHSSAVIPALASSPGSYRGRGAIGEVKDGAAGGSFLVLRDPDPECRPVELEDPTPGSISLRGGAHALPPPSRVLWARSIRPARRVFRVHDNGKNALLLRPSAEREVSRPAWSTRPPP